MKPPSKDLREQPVVSAATDSRLQTPLLDIAGRIVAEAGIAADLTHRLNTGAVLKGGSNKNLWIIINRGRSCSCREAVLSLPSGDP